MEIWGIRELRESLGLDLTEGAEVLQTSRATLSRLERQLHVPDGRLLLRVSAWGRENRVKIDWSWLEERRQRRRRAS